MKKNLTTLYNSLEIKGFMREQVKISVNKDKSYTLFLDNVFIITCSFFKLNKLITEYMTDVTYVNKKEDLNPNNIFQIIKKL